METILGSYRDNEKCNRNYHLGFRCCIEIHRYIYDMYRVQDKQ